MPRFSRNQARLARILVQGQKTAKELRDELGVPLHEVDNDLAVLIKAKVVEKVGGYPTKYQAVEAVRSGIMSEKPSEEHFFRAHVIIEGQSKEKAALLNATKQLVDKINKDSVVIVTNLVEDDVVHEDNTYKNLVELDVAAKHFEDMVYFVVTYGPSSIELDPFEEYALKSTEAQGIVMDVASVLQAYINVLVQKELAIKQKDLEIQQYRKNSPELFIK